MILGSRPTLRVTFDSLYSCGSNFWLKHKYASRGGSQFLRPYLSFAILQEINTCTECSGCPIFSLKMCLPSQRHYWTWFSIFWDPSIIRLTLRCNYTTTFGLNDHILYFLFRNIRLLIYYNIIRMLFIYESKFDRSC